MTISEQRRIDLEKAIKLYQEIYNDNQSDRKECFVEYSGFYHITNEPINAILQKINFSGDTKLLSVLSGGDQVLNFVNIGIKNIDTFDINRITEYYALGFKKRAVECLSYEQFLKLFSYNQGLYGVKHYNLYPELENYVIENMEEEYRWFWQEFKYVLLQEGFDPSIFHLATFSGSTNSIAQNAYLKNKCNYKNLQNSLKEARITFKQTSILDLPENFGAYNLIYLSNIMDYSKDFYSNVSHPLVAGRNLLNRISEQNLTSSGEIIMTYLTGSFIPFIGETLFFKNRLEEIFFNKEIPSKYAYRLLKK